jgi:hypothetical protein
VLKIDVSAPIVSERLVLGLVKEDHDGADPAGVAHVPSPRQNVELEAEVPEFRFPTGRFPVTSALARLTALLVQVCVDPAKWQSPTPGEDATTRFADRMPES